MSTIIRDFFVDSVSTNQVQLRRTPGLTSMPSGFAGTEMHQITITTGEGSAANADTAFFQATCLRYRVTIERIS